MGVIHLKKELIFYLNSKLCQKPRNVKGIQKYSENCVDFLNILQYKRATPTTTGNEWFLRIHVMSDSRDCTS